MNSTHEDAVLSFDLDFLHPTSNNIPVQALKQRYIGQIKKRIIRVDALNSHCNSLKIDLYNKTKELELIKKKLESTNLEHTQTSLEYKEVLENYSRCQMECHNLKTAVNNYQEKYFEAENRVHAGKSHVVQLQQLVKQYERKIDILEQNERRKSDKTLRDGIEKELLQWKKKYKKEISEWQTKYDTLLKQVQNTKNSTGKLTKQVSLKINEKNCNDLMRNSVSHEDNIENEDEISVDFTSSYDNENSSPNNVDVVDKPSPYDNENSSSINVDVTQNSFINKQNKRMEVDSDSKIESISVDTGCGSSLASSDNEKWLNSPDYVFSPINGESTDKILSRKLVDIATSPLLPVQMTVVATSPAPSVVKVDVATSPITIQAETCKESESKVINVELTEPNNNIVDTELYSPGQNLDEAPHTIIHEKKSDKIDKKVPEIDVRETQTRTCLQLNNSNNIEEDCSTDHEIEMILSSMRFNHKLITPIPKTPKKVGDNATASYDHNNPSDYLNQCTCPDASTAKDLLETAREEAAQARKDIAKSNECQTILISNLANLMKEMFYVKTFLKTRFSTPGTALEHLNDSIPPKELFENISSVNLLEDYHNLLNSANSLEKSVKQTDLVKSPTSSKVVPDSLITVISEEIIKPANIEHLNSKQHIQLPSPEKEMEPEKTAILNERSASTESEMCFNNNIEVEMLSSTKEKKIRRVKRLRKLTNLAKYRNKCEIRNRKIKRETPPLKKPRMKPKKLPQQGIKKVTRTDTSATLNDKQVYAKAVKVMAELNAKTSNDPVDNTLNTSIQKEISTINDHNSVIKCNPNVLSGMTSSRFSSVITSPTRKVNSPTLDMAHTTPEITATTQTISRRRSTRSAKLIDAFPEMTITTPDLIASSIPALRSPEPEIKSPKSPPISPKSPNKSPQPSNRSPKSQIISPKPPILSPTPTIRSSTPVISSPTPSITSHRRSRRLLEYATASPKSSFTSLNSDIISKHSSITSPEPDSIISKNFTSSIPTVTSPKPAKAPPIFLDSSKNYSEFSTSLSNQNLVVLHKDLSIDKMVQNAERKRKLSSSSDIQSKRVLRSSINQSSNTKEHTLATNNVVNDEVSTAVTSIHEDSSSWHPKESILCSMIQKYGINKVRSATRHVPDGVLKNVNGKIEQFLSKIHEGPLNKENDMMMELVEELKTYNYKNFVSGLTKYLTNPERKMELFGKISSPPAPQMTKSEAVLLYVIRQLRTYWQPVDIVETVLSNLEHTLFKLNRTPEFEVIESVSHFYALICRYFGLQSRLKVFMLDAMYCILFKSTPLIKQCLEVWPHIIPLAHMSAAKIPLVTIFVYLLHFYKCEDKFSRVQEIRNILQRRYSYEMAEWNQGKMLELVGNSISELRDIPCEKKMLRIAVIILAKRHGARWTQNNIIKKLFQFIEKENLPEHVTAFCVSLIGPLMKPYPIDMKVHCEIAMNQLLNILNTRASKRIEEASISSLIIMSRHNTQRVNEILLSRKMETMSPELGDLFRVHIRMKPLNAWIKTLSRPPMST